MIRVTLYMIEVQYPNVRVPTVLAPVSLPPRSE